MIKTTKFMDNFYIFDDGMVRQFLITGEKEALLIDAGFPGCPYPGCCQCGYGSSGECDHDTWRYGSCGRINRVREMPAS